MPVTLALVGGGIGLGETIFGGIKSSRANKEMAKLESNRPIYSRPDEIKQYLELAKTGYNSKMPGQSQIEQGLQQSTQGMVSKLQEAGQLDAGAIQRLYQTEMGAYNNLAMQQAQYHQSEQSKLAQALSESAKYADQEFEYNVNAPWQRKYNRAINKYEAGQQMMGQGFNAITSSVLSGVGKKPQTNPFMPQSATQTASTHSQILPEVFTPSTINTDFMLGQQQQYVNSLLAH